MLYTCQVVTPFNCTNTLLELFLIAKISKSKKNDLYTYNCEV